MLPVHVFTGMIAIVLGAVALIARKGGLTHRRVGLLFVVAMLLMASTGALLALRRSLTDPNVTGGVMAAYFVLTALTAVRKPSPKTRTLEIAAMVMGIALVLDDALIATSSYHLPGRAINGVPFFMPAIFGALITLAIVGDIRVIRMGGLKGPRRLARHLWRMCFALFIAAASFFSIRARVARLLPAPFTTGAMRALPIVLILGAMFYWLWRLRRRSAPALAIALESRRAGS